MAVARHAGAREVVATDIVDAPLAIARRMGADSTYNTMAEPDALTRFKADKGYFDVTVEASGSAIALDRRAGGDAPRRHHRTAGPGRRAR